ncbi:mannose-1-phosphate guanylyltransferase [Zeaxanthinibacter enoshimensis]|uniref:mannose-1-phosphate guanylyltransferase n=1 Tax=Zeaxanthinibacter enoshimensis TaxID=392009 RepID=UPI003565FEC6
MNKNYYAVVMAGGVGSRFWPLSTTENPKQFHDMLGSGQTLIQKTVNRLTKFIPTENILILTNQRYLSLVLEQLPMLSEEQVVLEPAMRNTAPCILYAALKIQKKNPDATMIVAPSDHWIEDEKAFEQDVKECFDRCEEENALCTLGITPTFPNTGFGYIEFDKTDQQGEPGLKKVVQFREKPDYQTAKSFLEQGNFLWNAGIFMWGVETIINAFKNYQPGTYSLFESGLEVYNTDEEARFIKENYPKAENISIDYAILEKSDRIYVLPASFDWNDLGTWGSLYEKMHDKAGDNAIVNGTLLSEDSSGNMIRTEEGKLVVIDSINDYIIVDKKDVLLIYPKQKEQHIKEVVSKVKDAFGDQYI